MYTLSVRECRRVGDFDGSADLPNKRSNQGFKRIFADG